MGVSRVDLKVNFSEISKNIFSSDFYQIQWDNFFSLCEKVALKIRDFMAHAFEFLKAAIKKNLNRSNISDINVSTSQTESWVFSKARLPKKMKSVSDSSIVLSANLWQAQINAQLNAKPEKIKEENKKKLPGKKQVRFSDLLI